MNGHDHCNDVIMIMLIYHVYGNVVSVACFIMIVPIYMYKAKSINNCIIKISFVLGYRNAVVHIQFDLL